MKNLERWLKKYNARNGKIDLPMLLIDDEADNASVNTKKSEEEQPTAINECIRSLLNVFSRSNYVGYTATPYANIFINPDSDDEMLSDDLFPRHFIYALNAPSNYIGATGIFDINGKYNYMLKSNLTEEELREIEESIDMNEIDKELENVNFQHDPN